jgi:hypothetical protein
MSFRAVPKSLPTNLKDFDFIYGDVGRDEIFFNEARTMTVKDGRGHVTVMGDGDDIYLGAANAIEDRVYGDKRLVGFGVDPIGHNHSANPGNDIAEIGAFRDWNKGGPGADRTGIHGTNFGVFADRAHTWMTPKEGDTLALNGGDPDVFRFYEGETIRDPDGTGWHTELRGLVLQVNTPKNPITNDALVHVHLDDDFMHGSKFKETYLEHNGKDLTKAEVQDYVDDAGWIL